MSIGVIAEVWSELIAAVVGALAGWWSRHFTPSKRGAARPPAKRK